MDEKLTKGNIRGTRGFWLNRPKILAERRPE